jgi:hypothetical protein
MIALEGTIMKEELSVYGFFLTVVDSLILFAFPSKYPVKHSGALIVHHLFLLVLMM